MGMTVEKWKIGLVAGPFWFRTQVEPGSALGAASKAKFPQDLNFAFRPSTTRGGRCSSSIARAARSAPPWAASA